MTQPELQRCGAKEVGNAQIWTMFCDLEEGHAGPHYDAHLKCFWQPGEGVLKNESRRDELVREGLCRKIARDFVQGRITHKRYIEDTAKAITLRIIESDVYVYDDYPKGCEEVITRRTCHIVMIHQGTCDECRKHNEKVQAELKRLRKRDGWE